MLLIILIVFKIFLNLLKETLKPYIIRNTIHLSYIILLYIVISIKSIYILRNILVATVPPRVCFYILLTKTIKLSFITNFISVELLIFMGANFRRWFNFKIRRDS